MSSATTTSPDMCSPDYTYTSRVEPKTSKFPQKTKKTKKKGQILIQISSVKLLNVSSNNAQQLESRLVVVVSSQEH
jgi:hypothetical protein